MGEKPSGVKALVPLPRAGAWHDGVAPAADREDLGVEIDAIRHRLGDLIGELDKRRLRAFDLRRQLRRHPVAFMVAAVVVVGAVAGLVVLKATHRHRPRRLRGAARRIGHPRTRTAVRIATTVTAVVLRAVARRFAARLFA